MANVAFSDLAELTSLAAADLLCVTDSSEAGAEQSKYIQLSTLRDYLLITGTIQRPQFTWSSGTSLLIGAGFYDVAGKWAAWTSQLTETLSSLSANTAYYVYLDYSGITSGTAVTATEVLISSTAPTYSQTYRGFYSGSDRCIFGFKTETSSANMREFFHSGNRVMYANCITDLSATDIDTTWTDVTLSIPGFATGANATFTTARPGNQDGKCPLWRTNGQTGTAGHYVSGPVADGGLTFNLGATDVITDSTQKIEVKMSGSNNQTLAIYTNGWCFPVGM